MKIFISYRRADSREVVDRMRERLVIVYGHEAIFRDIDSIPLGMNFKEVLDEATATCDVMLVIIGPLWASITFPNSDKKRLDDPGDFTRIEVETGLAYENILVIPVLVKNAVMPSSNDIPESLRTLLFRNATNVRGDPDFDIDIQRLVSGINKSIGGALPISKKDFEPETIYVPAGPFLMGSAKVEGIPDYEMPQHEVFLPKYRIGKYPVTNKQYAEFMHDPKTRKSDIGWKRGKIPEGKNNHSVTGVSWKDALAYCKWLSGKTGRTYFLPNEAQWEKACRGKKFANNSKYYPWGDDFKPELISKPGLSAIDDKNLAPQNDYGCFDFVGSVQQWTCSLWGTKYAAPDPEYIYPWDDDGRNDLDKPSLYWRVLRGSPSEGDRSLLRCSYKCGDSTESRFPNSRYGFRVAMTVDES